MWLPVDAEFLSVAGNGVVHAARRADVLDGSRLLDVHSWPTVCGAEPLGLVLVEVERSEPFVAPFPPPRRVHPTFGVSCVSCMLTTGLREFGQGSALRVDEADS